jgi:chromosomal replication initiator protein
VSIAPASICDHGASAILGGFIAGPENRLVEVAINDLLGEASSLYSPMVLYGPPGVGKSHLALAVVAQWKARPDHPPVKYAVAIDLARELAEAIETKTLDGFGDAYRRAALLVLEDLQHLAGKEAAQRELLHILDHLADEKARVLVTVSRSPAALDDMLPALQSRLQAGLAIPVAMPGPAARAMVLRRLAQSREMELPEPLVEFLVDNVSGTVAALDATLIGLQMGGKVDVEAARRWLADHRGREPSLREIALATARHFSLRLGDLRSAARRRTLVIARGVAMYLCRSLTHQSLDQIGAYFGGRDHTTVSHAAEMSWPTGRTCPLVVGPVCVAGQRLTASSFATRERLRSDNATTAPRQHADSFPAWIFRAPLTCNPMSSHRLAAQAGYLSTFRGRIRTLLQERRILL